MQTYQVAGMVCGHCATFVSNEIKRLPGVTAVAVDVAAGVVTVTSDRELPTAEVRGAVEDAGYELEPAST